MKESENRLWVGKNEYGITYVDQQTVEDLFAYSKSNQFKSSYLSSEYVSEFFSSEDEFNKPESVEEIIVNEDQSDANEVESHMDENTS